MNNLEISNNGLKLIKSFEGCRLTAYLCPAGVWTIGYGHTGNVKKGQKITQQEAEKLLLKDLERFEKAVNELVKVPLAQYEFDALVSFCYNVGITAFQKSTLLKKLNTGLKVSVPSELNKWVFAGGKKLPGLVRRREAEALMWKGVY